MGYTQGQDAGEAKEPVIDMLDGGKVLRSKLLGCEICRLYSNHHSRWVISKLLINVKGIR